MTATDVAVTVTGARDGLEVVIVDDGVGLGPIGAVAQGHRGLLNMEDRAAVLGGRIERATVARTASP